MVQSRLNLQTLLESLVPEGAEVYFQAPANDKMVYPCILYIRDDIQVQHADNLPYSSARRYQVTVIDRNPDSTIVDKVAALPYCSYVRSFASENLNHDIFTLYFGKEVAPNE